MNYIKIKEKMFEVDFSKALLRIGLSFVFLAFAFMQVTSPDNWASFIPEFLVSTIITANNWVILNGILELVLGIFLLLGIYVRFSSLVLAVHLFFISLSVGLSPIGIRDFGLTIATFVVFLNGVDKYCFEKKGKHF